MGLIDWLGRRLNNTVFSTTSLQQVGSRAIYPDYKSDELIKSSFSGNDVVYTIVTTTSKKFASIPKGVFTDTLPVKRYKSSLKYYDPFQVKKEFKSLGTPVEDSEYMKLLKRPNPMMAQDSFFEAVYMSREILGESFIWINRGDSTVSGDARYSIKPLELYWLPAQHMELVVDSNDYWGVLGYVLNNSGVKIYLNKEDVIHWKTFNPNFDINTREHLRGLSPMRAGSKLLAGNDASKDAMVAMFQNDGAKGLIFNETLDHLDPGQKSSIENVINKKINNRDVKGSIATLQGKWGYIDLGKTTVDMQLLEAQETTFSRFCNLWRVSPNLFLAGQTRDNLREARKDLITNKILPDTLSFEDELNRVLSKSFSGQVVVSDFTSLPEMQYEMADMNIILAAMYDRGIISGAEYREQMGYEPSGQSEHDMYFFKGTMTPITEATLPPMDNILPNDYAGNSGEPNMGNGAGV